MVNVPVENENFLSLVSCMLSGNRNIIEKAETVDVLTVRVVSWRPYYAISALMLPA